MAELLIKAQDPWRVTDTGTRKGDIIVVCPDGWKWGREECLPHFVVVKTEETFEEAKKYEDSLTEEKDGEMVVLKVRKHHVPTDEVDARSEEVRDFTEIRAVSLRSSILEKKADGRQTT